MHPAANIELVISFWNLFSDQEWDRAKDLLADHFVAEWPQSRERMVGAANFIDVNRNYPGNHRIQVIHADAIGNRVITTVWIEADTGQKTFATSYFEIIDGKITKAEEYWAEPYAAPEWRRKWVNIY